MRAVHGQGGALEDFRAPGSAQGLMIGEVGTTAGAGAGDAFWVGLAELSGIFEEKTLGVVQMALGEIAG